MPKRQSSSSSSQDESSQQQIIQFVSVIVSKLTPNVTQQHLFQIFSHFATVKSVLLNKGPKLTSTALIKFEKKEQAQLAIRYMNKGFIDGSKISVEHEQQSLKVDKLPEKKSVEKVTKSKKIKKDRKDRQWHNSRDKHKQRREKSTDRKRDKEKKKKHNEKQVSSSSSSAVSSSGSEKSRSSKS